LGHIILISVIWATVFYVSVILAASYVTPWLDLRTVALPTAVAFRRAFTTPVMADLVLWAAIAGLITSWNGFFIAGTRVLFALGRARMVSPRLGAVHARHGTPHAAVWLVGGITALSCLLGEKALLTFVNVSSVCLAAAFLGVSLSAARLRRSAPDLERPYRMPGDRHVPAIAAAGSLLICVALIVPRSPAALRWPLDWLLFGGWCLLGAVLWRLATPVRSAVPEEERARLILNPED
jgi:amino acid transporter